MSRIKRIVVFVAVLIFILSVTLPLSAFAVDPVSATVMANAFAQAIAAYGASNGVAMTFDVSSTDGIGETVHELWKDFREGTQTPDDYATIAQAIFPELYYKTSVAIGTASDVYAVGVHISDTYAQTLDEFYNWLLSGPAEMVQVDNSYYEFSQAQIGPNSSPISVLSVSTGVFAGQPLPRQVGTMQFPDIYALSYKIATSSALTFGVVNRNRSTSDLYVFHYQSSVLGHGNANFCIVGLDNGDSYWATTYYNSTNETYNRSDWASLGSYSYDDFIFDVWSISPVNSVLCPSFSTDKAGLDALASFLDSPPSDTVGVKAYGNQTVADIPDVYDPNYDALNRAKDIPLNIPWDDAIYGDGTGTLTDAQTEAIADDVVAALEQDQIVELVEEDNPPAPIPDPDYPDVLLPLIPINIPSFNFSLSGIWHYVRDWFNSLGAWLSTLFSVWSVLPYAIVVPVYASLVVVIVLGLYKRFFM